MGARQSEGRKRLFALPTHSLAFSVFGLIYCTNNNMQKMETSATTLGERKAASAFEAAFCYAFGTIRSEFIIQPSYGRTATWKRRCPADEFSGRNVRPSSDLSAT